MRFLFFVVFAAAPCAFALDVLDGVGACSDMVSCSGHGAASTAHGVCQCECQVGWVGLKCETVSPLNCPGFVRLAGRAGDWMETTIAFKGSYAVHERLGVTVELLVRFRATPGRVQRLFDNGGYGGPLEQSGHNEVLVYITPDNELVATRWVEGVHGTATSAALVPEKWYHVAASFDVKGNTVLYVDGFKVASALCTMEDCSSAHSVFYNVTIGSFRNSSTAASATENFNGDISFIRLWDRPRTSAEIQRTMECSADVTFEQGLLAFWGEQAAKLNVYTDLWLWKATRTVDSSVITVATATLHGSAVWVNEPVPRSDDCFDHYTQYELGDLVDPAWVAYTPPTPLALAAAELGGRCTGAGTVWIGNHTTRQMCISLCAAARYCSWSATSGGCTASTSCDPIRNADGDDAPRDFAIFRNTASEDDAQLLTTTLDEAFVVQPDGWRFYASRALSGNVVAQFSRSSMSLEAAKARCAGMNGCAALALTASAVVLHATLAQSSSIDVVHAEQGVYTPPTPEEIYSWRTIVGYGSLCRAQGIAHNNSLASWSEVGHQQCLVDHSQRWGCIQPPGVTGMCGWPSKHTALEKCALWPACHAVACHTSAAASDADAKPYHGWCYARSELELASNGEFTTYWDQESHIDAVRTSSSLVETKPHLGVKQVDGWYFYSHSGVVGTTIKTVDRDATTTLGHAKAWCLASTAGCSGIEFGMTTVRYFAVVQNMWQLGGAIIGAEGVYLVPAQSCPYLVGQWRRAGKGGVTHAAWKIRQNACHLRLTALTGGRELNLTLGVAHGAYSAPSQFGTKVRLLDYFTLRLDEDDSLAARQQERLERQVSWASVDPDPDQTGEYCGVDETVAGGGGKRLRSAPNEADCLRFCGSANFCSYEITGSGRCRMAVACAVGTQTALSIVPGQTFKVMQNQFPGRASWFTEDPDPLIDGEYCVAASIEPSAGGKQTPGIVGIDIDAQDAVNLWLGKGTTIEQCHTMCGHSQICMFDTVEGVCRAAASCNRTAASGTHKFKVWKRESNEHPVVTWIAHATKTSGMFCGADESSGGGEGVELRGTVSETECKLICGSAKYCSYETTGSGRCRMASACDDAATQEAESEIHGQSFATFVSATAEAATWLSFDPEPDVEDEYCVSTASGSTSGLHVVGLHVDAEDAYNRWLGEHMTAEQCQTQCGYERYCMHDSLSGACRSSTNCDRTSISNAHRFLVWTRRSVVRIYSHNLERAFYSKVTAPVQCQEMCQRTLGCSHWTWRAHTGCSLKHSKVGSRHFHFISGPRDSCQGGVDPQACFELETEYAGSDVYSEVDGKQLRSLDQRSPLECQRWCQTMSACRGFTWASPSLCVAKGDDIGRRRAYFTSGPKLCPRNNIQHTACDRETWIELLVGASAATAGAAKTSVTTSAPLFCPCGYSRLLAKDQNGRWACCLGTCPPGAEWTDSDDICIAWAPPTSSGTPDIDVSEACFDDASAAEIASHLEQQKNEELPFLALAFTLPPSERIEDDKLAAMADGVVNMLPPGMKGFVSVRVVVEYKKASAMQMPVTSPLTMMQVSAIEGALAKAIFAQNDDRRRRRRRRRRRLSSTPAASEKSAAAGFVQISSQSFIGDPVVASELRFEWNVSVPWTLSTSTEASSTSASATASWGSMDAAASSAANTLIFLTNFVAHFKKLTDGTAASIPALVTLELGDVDALQNMLSVTPPMVESVRASITIALTPSTRAALEKAVRGEALTSEEAALVSGTSLGSLISSGGTTFSDSTFDSFINAIRVQVHDEISSKPDVLVHAIATALSLDSSMISGLEVVLNQVKAAMLQVERSRAWLVEIQQEFSAIVKKVMDAQARLLAAQALIISLEGNAGAENDAAIKAAQDELRIVEAEVTDLTKSLVILMDMANKAKTELQDAQDDVADMIAEHTATVKGNVDAATSSMFSDVVANVTAAKEKMAVSLILFPPLSFSRCFHSHLTHPSAPSLCFLFLLFFIISLFSVKGRRGASRQPRRYHRQLEESSKQHTRSARRQNANK